MSKTLMKIEFGKESMTIIIVDTSLHPLRLLTKLGKDEHSGYNQFLKRSHNIDLK